MYVGSRSDTKPGIAPPPAEVSPRPRQLGRYRLLERVGAGGMAEIFRAVAEGPHGFERTVAIKRVLEHVASMPEVGKLFADEARISALLDHRNIVQIFDFGAVEGTYFIAMEYLKGHNLDEILYALRKRREHLEPSAAVFVAREVARGLAYAHGLQDESGRPYDIVHRDVSPANVMLLYSGAVKLLDFGIARVKSELRLAVTQGRALRGKCPYLAPEQITGAPVDARSDLFALGSMLWEMLAGQRLFGGDSELDIIGSVLHREIPPPSALAPGIPPALDRIVLTALARDPERRYRSAEALAADLDGVLRALPERHEDLAALLDALFPHQRPTVATPTQPLAETPMVRPQDLITRPARFAYAPAAEGPMQVEPPGISEEPTHKISAAPPAEAFLPPGSETPRDPVTRVRDRRALLALIGGLACLPMAFTMVAFEWRRHEHPASANAAEAYETHHCAPPAPAEIAAEPGLYCAPAASAPRTATSSGLAGTLGKHRSRARMSRTLALGRTAERRQVSGGMGRRGRATDLHVDPFDD